MSDLATATIIPFPSRTAARVPPMPAAPVPPPSPEDDRLARALAGLTGALAAQKEAMADWQASLDELRTVTGRLGTSLRRDNDSLERLDAQIGTLRDEAHTLESWADSAMARSH